MFSLPEIATLCRLKQRNQMQTQQSRSLVSAEETGTVAVDQPFNFIILPENRTILMSTCNDSDRIFKSLQMDTNGYQLRRASAEEILRAIQHGSSSGVAQFRTNRTKEDPRSAGNGTGRVADVLSKRESEVLHYLSHGHTDKEVASALGLTTATVRSYLKRVYSKLKVHSRTQAIRRQMIESMSQ